MRQGSFRLFLVFLIGAVLTGSSLILMVPALVDPAGSLSTGLAIALALVVLGCGFGAHRARPDRRLSR